MERVTEWLVAWNPAAMEAAEGGCQRLLLEELRLLLYQPHSGSLRSMSCAIRFSNQS